MAENAMKSTRDGVEVYNQFIGGQWVECGGELLDVTNPATGEVVGRVGMATAEDADRALKAADRAFQEWRRKTAVERADLLFNLVALIRDHSERLARLITSEQGKPLSEARGDVGMCCDLIRFAAEHTRRLEGDIIPADSEDEQIWIQKVPHGVVVGITAWNFPAALIGRKLGPALAAGNTIVLKPSEETPLTALELVELARQAGIPEGVVNLVNGRGRDVGNHLVTSPITQLVSMTGSVRGGREINKAAAEHLKIVRLELGGKAPFIVMDDADLEPAVEAAIVSRFTNNGQVCTCNERMYVHEGIHDRFLERFKSRVEELKVGDPLRHEDVDIGPKINSGELDKVHQMVEHAVSQGAQLETGGQRLTGGEYDSGNYYSPTILTGVNNDMDIMKEEIFGPVVPIMKVDSFEQALDYANDSEYGLSAYVFTQNVRRLMTTTRELDFGEIYVNRGGGESVQGFHKGYRNSGLGGEDGKYGLEAYVKSKTLYVHY
ncbi:lactaldehyde dehydrogenase/glycolaldehyde dehydrogenase [Kushneria sinocarnis]|uniref:Lactaldehyde dehydrogenase/glycolaldehyde dehydrogenase n=1 Tax=Kushneria sinocarnis TaxID=595502 RepID=A0A420WUP3_9GAMM|nr:aldehyde dehydrogenase [Kushneria sinocarnis]RKQ97179.1 lactaldehyde dehydrogenase/glycolaldehyde dehydrogenase [Kushneria sinocarnis]